MIYYLIGSKWSLTFTDNKVHIVVSALKDKILRLCGFPAIASMLFSVRIDLPPPFPLTLLI